MPGNPTHFWVWPEGQETEAEAYAAAANAAWATLANEPGGVWSLIITDVHNQPVVAKFWGGPWKYSGAIIPEGPTEAALRASAAEVEDWDRPPEE